jgi:hypothetical protein
MQDAAEVHDTADSALKVAPVGVAVVCIVHVVPFQASATVSSVPALLP